MRLVHASISENNTGYNAVPGDQTGKEVCIRSWYCKPWDYVLRFPSTTARNTAVKIAKKLANSNLVGYNKGTRNSLYTELKKNGFDVDKYIESGVKTETDCSAFIYAVWCCVLDFMRKDGNAPTTGTMKNLYDGWGFAVLSAVKYNANPGKLKPGDIVVKAYSHTALVIPDKTKITDEPRINIPKYTKEVNNAITTLALDVISGKWGSGNDRKELLYTAIQTRVNELTKK